MNYWESKNLGLSLDICELDCATLLSKLQPKTILGQMSELEAGAIANPDENRMVGHYWLRSPKLAPSDEITKNIQNEIERIIYFEKNCNLRNVLLIGIGGSSLGPKLLNEALLNKSSKRKLFFIDNTDPDGIAKTIAEIEDLSTCLVIITSKSGSTKETRNAYLEVSTAFKKQKLEIEKQTVAVTLKDSILDSDKFLERFYFWDWVGGRTSLTSSVGLLPLCLLGADIKSLLSGASEMDRETRNADASKNPAFLLALSWLEYSNRGAKSMVVLPYADRFEYFPRYLQQLVMESLGKEKDLDGKTVNSGLTVYGNKGSTDQHAYVQQLRDGPDNFFVTFIEILKNASTCEVEPGITAADYLFGFLEGTKKALTEKGRKSITIALNEINEKTLGALIALYERAVGLYAYLINVNAYNQPGVEAGKLAAAEILSLHLKVKKLLMEQAELAKEPVKIAKLLNADQALVERICRRL